MTVKTIKKRKQVVTEGIHTVSTLGGRKRVKITADDLRNIAKTGNEMVAAGLKIPAPWKHDLQATPFYVGEEPKDVKPYDNAGFWSDFKVIETPKGCVLDACIESPGDENDPKSPAFAVGNLVKDTSFYVEPTYLDGRNREWKQALRHIAVCHDPIELDQENFRDIDADTPEPILMSQLKEGTGIAMSQLEKPMTDMSGLLDLLSKAGITLPSDTDEMSFVDRLRTALTVYTQSKNSNPLNTPSDKAEYATMPVFMSALGDNQIQALVKSGAINPVTEKAFVEADFKAGEAPSKEDYNSLKELTIAMSSQLKETVTKSYQDRIASLVKRGALSKEKANQRFVPMLEGIAMNSGAFCNPTLDTALEILEDVAAAMPEDKETPSGTPHANPDVPAWLMSATAPDGTVTHPNPLDEEADGQALDDATANEIIKSLVAQA